MKIEVDFSKTKTRVKRISSKLMDQVEENPVAALVIGGVALQGGAKLMKANTERKNAKTWRREVARRERKQNS